MLCTDGVGEAGWDGVVHPKVIQLVPAKPLVTCF